MKLLRGTNNFEELNLIGKGSLGMVYKGTFTNETVVAVKVFNAQVQDAFKRFDLECKVLYNNRHRNLVKVISSCANLDFKALVLAYMPNRDLDYWLYSHNNFLDLILIQKIKLTIRNQENNKNNINRESKAPLGFSRFSRQQRQYSTR
ncbi:hypothetical protein CQW23_00824 [Capsicum baccatum]|uniref:Protein kinase domain-containing protein n=1 Tax=Capsicum baccatum TaxID=33114 RepID=A0A2G2XM74_CAPBA|nr:hypothetical protein CQW23_00824 [Capsicum baccatum]